MRLEVVTTALLVAIISICMGKIRHFPRKEERPADSGYKVATELGMVSSVFPSNYDDLYNNLYDQ